MQRLTAKEAMDHPYLKPIKVQREEAEATQKQSGAMQSAPIATPTAVNAALPAGAETGTKAE